MMSPESLAAADGNIVRWFEQDFGGTVIDLARQTRWRACGATRSTTAA